MLYMLRCSLLLFQHTIRTYDSFGPPSSSTADRWQTPFLDFLFHHRTVLSKAAVAFLSSLMNYENLINLYSSPLLPFAGCCAARRKCLRRANTNSKQQVRRQMAHFASAMFRMKEALGKCVL